MDAYCGLYCGACLCNIVLETGNIEEVVAKTGRTIEQLTCTDCKTAKHEDCCFVTCCIAKGIDNCSECAEMPCDELTRFANDQYKHHSASIPNLLRIRETGLDVWLTEQQQQYTCAGCGARVGWTHKTCDKCGHLI